MLEDIPKKLREKMVAPDLSSLESRLEYIRSCDTRTLVASATLICWHLSRVLLVKHEPHAAYILGADVQEFLTEESMDARKGGSVFSDPRFDIYKFLGHWLRGKERGGDIDFCLLRSVGFPQNVVNTMEEAWTICEGELLQFVSQSPIYSALVIKRNNLTESIPQMLSCMKSAGIESKDVYAAICEDLMGRKLMS